MRVFKLSLLFVLAALFIAGCNRSGDIYDQPYDIGRVQSGVGYDNINRLDRGNLDLQALGGLLQEADNAQELEYMLNSPEYGINNLDLNEDGYTDYVSVREFGDGNERGFSLLDMFGPELIQEIATIFLDRNGYGDNGYYPGARVLLRGNEDLYGDNYYYETNWADQSIPFIDWAFNDRNGYYESPYYYQNYPSYYQPYTIVEQPVYQTRVEQYYTQYAAPVFVQTPQPSVTQIRVESPYKDKSLEKVYAKLPKAPRADIEARKNVPGPPDFVRERQQMKNESRDFSVKENKQFNENPNRVERQERVPNERPQQMREMREMREKPNKPERVERQNEPKFERQNQQKFERQNQMRVERQPQRMERPQPQMRQQQMRQQPQPQQMRQQPQMRPQPQQNGNGGGNRGGGNGNGGGGGNRGNGGGGGKGKGKP